MHSLERLKERKRLIPRLDSHAEGEMKVFYSHLALRALSFLSDFTFQH